METFGPDPNEITVPSADGRSVHVIGFDGTLRDTLDVAAVTSQKGGSLTDLAWSRDGSALAVSTSSDGGPGCDGSGAVACVWIVARDGGVPVPSSTFAQSARLVYAEREQPVIRDLAWSPDGSTLALLVAPGMLCFPAAPEQAEPRLVALRVAATPYLAETLYDDYGVEERVCVVPDDYHVALPFAWSPDGTRIAVTRGKGINEISAEDGEVLARHPGEGLEGPLAWLPRRGNQP